MTKKFLYWSEFPYKGTVENVLDRGMVILVDMDYENAIFNASRLIARKIWLEELDPKFFSALVESCTPKKNVRFILGSRSQGYQLVLVELDKNNQAISLSIQAVD